MAKPLTSLVDIAAHARVALQLAVLIREAARPTHPILDAYQVVIVAFSGGKDSVACVLHLLESGVEPDRIELWHHDVDGRDEGGDPCADFMDWPVTREYCQAFADAHGLKIFFSWKVDGFKGELLREKALTKPTCWENPDGTIGKSGGVRGKKNTRRKFPQVTANLMTRWCSAVLKIDVCTTAIRNQARFVGRGVRTLLVTGERAEESTARANYETMEADRADLRDGRTPRHVDRWRPVHGWSEAEVWEIMKRWRVDPHPAYKIGFARVSCALCIFGNADQFASGRAVAPAQFAEVAGLESEFGVTIKRRVSLPVLADKGTPYPGCSSVNAKAVMCREYPAEDIIIPDHHTWRLPAGAFAEGCGPS